MSENMSYTPHAFNLTFLKNRLEFWTEIFRAIFLNMKAHMREVSSKSEMVTWRDFWKLGHLSRNDPAASCSGISPGGLKWFLYVQCLLGEEGRVSTSVDTRL